MNRMFINKWPYVSIWARMKFLPLRLNLGQEVTAALYGKNFVQGPVWRALIDL